MQMSESSIRRHAAEQGYILVKSRLRGWPTPDDKGEFMLLRDDMNIPVLGWHYDADLDEIAEYLA